MIGPVAIFSGNPKETALFVYLEVQARCPGPELLFVLDLEVVAAGLTFPICHVVLS